MMHIESLPFIFIVNLPSRTDRRAHMDEFMRNLGVTLFEYVQPITPTSIPSAKVTKNEFSLMLTIQTIFDKAKERKLGTFMVFEDDIMIKSDTSFASVNEKMKNVMKNLPTAWDMVYFEYCFESCDQITPYNDYLFHVANPLCAASILYNTASVNKIRRCMFDQKKNLDNAYASCAKKKELDCFLVNPPLFFQDNAYETNIQTNVSTFIKSIIFDFNDHDETKHEPNKPSCKSEVFSHIKWKNVFLLLLILVILFVILTLRLLKAT
jgi:GR25 family glycosyltransferase involved in LPS biosynthesis